VRQARRDAGLKSDIPRGRLRARAVYHKPTSLAKAAVSQLSKDALEEDTILIGKPVR